MTQPRQPRVVYKALDEGGRSPFKRWKWPLPTDDEPGEWVEIEGPPRLCYRGFHGYHEQTSAEQQAALVFEMEVEGDIVEDGAKLAATRARLLRRVATFEAIRVGFGMEPCEKCGKPHDYYQLSPDPKGLHSWADRNDGHSYVRTDARELMRSVLAVVDGSSRSTVSKKALLEALGRA